MSLDAAAPIYSDHGIDQLLAQSAQPSDGRFFVRASKTRITDDIRRENGRELAPNLVGCHRRRPAQKWREHRKLAQRSQAGHGKSMKPLLRAQS